MNVLSLFDGISGARIALDRAGIKVTNYYASEIDKYAIQIAQKNYPDTIQLGDVTKLKSFGCLPKIHLVIGGSPCTNLSMAGNREGLVKESGLFWEYLRILKEIRPEYFLLENVKMKKEFRDAITKELGVDPILFNSSRVSAQSRERLYWTNLFFDRTTLIHNAPGVVDIIQDKKLIPLSYSSRGRGKGKVEGRFSYAHKACTLTKTGYSKRSSTALYDLLPEIRDGIRMDLDNVTLNLKKSRELNCIEHERLQTFPDDYTWGISEVQRKKALGNSFTVDVIAHFLRGICV